MAKKVKPDKKPIAPTATTQRSGPSSVDPVDGNNDSDSFDKDTSQLRGQKTASYEAMRIVQEPWSERERLLIARNADTYSQKTTRSHVTDSHLSTLAFERQARVAAQLPTGSIHSLSAKDEQSAVLMNMVLNKYILPNANSQMDALSKLRMSGVYASVYGAQPILYDYRIDEEYIGPDFWLIPPRNFFPQPGKNSIRDSDWAMVSNIVSVSYLEEIASRDKTNWNKDELNRLIELAKNGSVPSRDLDSSKKSAVENIRTMGRPVAGKGPAARVELITKYEKGSKGNWITFASDYEEVGILRSIPNPHKNGRIPIVMRQCFPLIDSMWGLGDFERGITLQKAKDSLLNLYLDGVKLAIFPPLKIDVANVTYSSIQMQAGARWLMKDPNAVTPYESDPASLQTFQGTWQSITSMLLNQFGTNDQSTINKEDSGNPAFGKTPAAIQQFQDREGARDNWDRFQLERTIEDLLEGMINLLSENQEKPINFHVFDSDVETIKNMFGEPDVSDKQMPPKFMKQQGNAGLLTISKNQIAGKYKFIVDASSTIRQDEDAQVVNLTQILTTYAQNPQAFDQWLNQDGFQFHAGKAFKSLVFNAGVNDPDTIITDMNQQPANQPPQPDPLDTSGVKDPQLRQLAEQLFNGPQSQQTGQPQGQQMPAAQGQPQQQQGPAPSSPAESLNYKDAPPDIQRQIEQQAGLQPSTMIPQQQVPQPMPSQQPGVMQ